MFYEFKAIIWWFDIKLFALIFPICLYLNPQDEDMERLELNLHSNMSLLNYTIHLATYISFRFTFRYVSILIGSHFIGYCLDIEWFTFQYVSILIHRPNSRFFSTLFPHFLLTSQSLQIFYHISFINSTKEKQNHLFFMFVEFCRCTGIFTLSEGDSLKIVGTE